MQVEKEDVLHIAKLACLKLKEEEIEEYRKNLQDILNFANIVNGVNTENVTDMSYMFCWCISLKKLDLSSFNTSNVTDMSSMFDATKVLMDLSKFDTKNVTNMTAMFSGYQGTYLDLTSFNTKDLKKLSDEEYQIYSNFKENYLDIYFPFL